ncbi:MAG: protoporphyrinogen oxidase [Microthrixaceae bacterium]
MTTGPGGVVARHVVVVGGGITGLAAAWEAVHHPGVTVTVLEAGDRLGGKVRTSALELPTGPLVVDEGADNFLARVPDAVRLCEELGLADELVTPRVGRALVALDGRLLPYPLRHVLGVPLDLDDLAATGILSADGLAAVAAERDRPRPAPGDDVAIGPYLAERFGAELVDHVVGPLVGGINAGDVEELSLRAVVPQLADAAAAGGVLSEVLRERLAAAPPAGPVFLAVPGGTGRLVATLAARLAARGADVRTGAPVVALDGGAAGDPERGATKVRLASGEELTADAVVLTTPTSAAAPLVRAVSPAAAALLDGIDHVPVAFVAFAFDRDGAQLPEGFSGALVPRDAGMLLTAASFGSAKWAAWDDGRHVVLRAAAGHRHDRRHTDLDDDELTAALLGELRTVLDLTGEPVAARVTRWDPGFAQYTVGHPDRVERIGRLLAHDAPTVAVAGADLGGLGLPACIRQGREAVQDLLRRTSRRW